MRCANYIFSYRLQIIHFHRFPNANDKQLRKSLCPKDLHSCLVPGTGRRRKSLHDSNLRHGLSFALAIGLIRGAAGRCNMLPGNDLRHGCTFAPFAFGANVDLTYMHMRPLRPRWTGAARLSLAPSLPLGGMCLACKGSSLPVRHRDIRIQRDCFSPGSDLESRRDVLLLAQGEPDLRSGADTLRSA